MNPHYHPYSDLSSPHSPSPDNNNYPPLSHHNGHSTLSQMDGHHQGFHHMNGTMKSCTGCGGEIHKSFTHSQALFPSLPLQAKLWNDTSCMLWTDTGTHRVSNAPAALACSLI